MKKKTDDDLPGLARAGIARPDGRLRADRAGKVLPGIEARSIPGFRRIDLMRREIDGEVEFQTIMWLDSLAAVVAFVGEDSTLAYVPAAARAVLLRYDERAALIDQRDQAREDS